MSSPDVGPAADGDVAASRAAVRSGVLAYFVDQFDIYLPVVVLAPATAYFQSTTLSPGTSAILTALVFASTLVARPLGAAVFGHYADTVGRRNTTLVAVAGFGVTTLLIALLPGYVTIGLWSVGLLIGLRFVDGFFLGGEYTTAVPLAMEWSPKQRRGLTSGLITASSPLAYAVIAAITLLLLGVIPAAGPDSAYSTWGWRIPFVIGALLAAVLFVTYRRAVHEPPTERTAAGARSPLAELLVGRHRRDLLQVFVLMSGAWLATTMATAVLPGLLASRVGLTSPEVTLVMLMLSLAGALTYPLLGVLSQRIGRRPFYLAFGVLMAVGGSSLFALLMEIRPGLWACVGLGVVIGFCCAGLYGPIAAYLTERFPDKVRASGYGVGYSLALILPSFYAFYMAGLGAFLPSYLTPVPLLVLGGVLVTVGAWFSPETRDVDMGAQARRPEAAVPERA